MAKARTRAQKAPLAPPPPRTRRTSEDARGAILDATEKRMVSAGLAGIRLQEVAKDVGVSHPTILHHFGSRERLVEAVVKRRVQAMNQQVILALLSAGPNAPSAESVFERTFEALGPGGYARVMAFIALEGRIPSSEPSSLRPLAEATHAARIARFEAKASKPDFEDTYFSVLLSAFALFAEAIVGPMFRGESEDAPDEAISLRFREWTARLIEAHLKTAPTALSKPRTKRS